MVLGVLSCIVVSQTYKQRRPIHVPSTIYFLDGFVRVTSIEYTLDNKYNRIANRFKSRNLLCIIYQIDPYFLYRSTALIDLQYMCAVLLPTLLESLWLVNPESRTNTYSTQVTEKFSTIHNNDAQLRFI